MVIAGRGGGESLQTPKVCANHDCYYALAVDSQPIAPVLRLALLKEETAIIGTWFAARAAAFDGMGNLNEGLLDEGYFIPSQGDEYRYWQSIYMLAQAGTGPALAVPQVIRAPSRVVQPQNHDGGAGHILATLQVRNIQVRAKWDVKNEGNNFTVSALAGDSRQGVLRVGDNITLDAGDYVVTVLAIDEFSYLNKSYENLTAMAELTIVAVIEPLRDVGEVVLAVTLIEDVGEAAAYTFAVAGGIAPYSYTFIESQGLSVDAASGVLSYLADGAAPGVYVVAVSVDDTAAAIAPIELLLTVEVSAALAAALSEGVKDGTYIFVNFLTELGKIMPSGGIGAYTFSLVSGNSHGYFTINSSLGVISVVSAPESEDGNSYNLVWTLNDGDQRSPEVTGTVSVQFTKSPSAENALRYAIVSEPYSETINIPVLGGLPDSTTGYTFSLSPASGYGLASTTGFTIVLNATNAIYIDAGVNYVTVSIHDSQNPPRSGTFVLEVRVVPKLTFSDTTLTISETESASLLSLVNGGNTMYAEDNDRTFVVISDSPQFTADNDGVLAVGGAAELLGLNTVTVQVMDTVPSQAATAPLVIDVLYKEVPVAFDIENSNFPSYIDPDVDLPLSITLKAIGGAQSPSYTFSISENDADWLSIEGGNVLVVKTGAPGGTHTFKIKVVEGNSTKKDGTEEDEAEITFTFVKPQAQATANGNVVVSGSESADGSYTSGQTFTFDPKTEQGVTIILGGASDTAVVVAENNQFRITLKYWTPADATEGLSYPEDGEYVFLDGKILAQAIKDGTITVYYFENSSEADEALAVKGGLLAVIAPAGIVDVQGIAIESGVSYIVCRLGEWGTICNFHSPSGLSTTLSATLSDGARDGAYSFVNLTGVLSAVELSGVGGIPPYTFTLLANDNFGIDEDGKNFRITAAFASATVVSVVWVLEDNNLGTPAVSGTVQVEISVPALSVALSDGAREGVHSYVKWTEVLSAVELSGVGGIPPYTFTLLANDNFGIDEDGKNFRITAAFASATVVSVVWVLEDSDLGTPAVSGTVQVEIRDIVRPPAMVRDIVGEILISGGGADGTYSTGETLAFDPNIGGVTVDVQAEGNSAVVWLENAQIRVNAGYIPQSDYFNPATGEWIFFSAREIAELVSLSADPEFKGENIYFSDATELKEAFSTPGMVAIIRGSILYDYLDIVSQVRYVVCNLVKRGDSPGNYICRIWLPTSDSSTTLSVALSDGARDGVHSYANFTGVVPGLELSGVGGIPPYTFTLLDNDNFGIDADGKDFRITAAFASATVVSVVWVLEDSNPWTPAVSGTVQVEISTPPLSVELSDGARDGAYSYVKWTGVVPGVELSGVGGIPPYTFMLLANDNFGIDEDGKNFRITAAFASATVVSVVWMLEDSDPGTPAVSGTVEVEVSVPSTLSVELSDGARDGVYSFVHLKRVLSAVELSGIGGIPPYTFTLLANDNFGIDEDGKNFRITAAFASATVASVVWVLEDSNPGTPSVSGTVRVEIIDDGFEYIVRPPAMIRDIVGEILISGGGADGTYSAGQTLTFDPNSGGVTVDVQANGNSAVVWLENAQIRVSARYIHQSFFNSSFREWIFFSAREIAELVSLSADPEFRGTDIVFDDDTGVELAEAFSTPGMVAIIVGSYLDIASQVRYVGCRLVESYRFREYNCRIQQPTSGFSATLSAALSDGARDGVHSFVKWTGVLPAVELSGAGGIPPYTFTLLANDNFGIDEDGKNFRITAAFASATVVSVVWVLEDSNPGTPAVSGTVRVEISTPLTLSVALSDGARDGAYSFVNLTGVLSAVELSGVGGIPPYTFTLLANDNFGIDEDGKNFRITAAFASATVVSVVWVLEDSNPGTPAVSGTVQVEISVPALSVALSDGARDGVHSFVSLTAVVPGVELSGVGGIPPYTFTLLANDNFGIDEDGKNFRITAAFASATVVSVVWVLEDSNPGTPAVSGTVEVGIKDELRFVDNSPVVNVTVGVKLDGLVYTAKAQKYENVAYSQIGYHPSFTVVVSDSSAGALVSMISPLSVAMTVTLTIRVVDDDGTQAILTLEVRAFDELSVALSDGARNGVHSFVNLTGVLSAVELSGVGGIPPYTFTLLANDNFGIDADGKNFRITAAFASATVVSVVWVLEDSNLGTPAVSGTVQVEIYVVRPPAMVSDIVGEILISGGDADGTYSAGATPTFDPNIGGVTVDVQAEGNSAVVWLDAQIRVSARYIPYMPGFISNPASGEWIFFSAREIAELVSLNAYFKGGLIGFTDATELAEAFSTPGMVAIIIGSEGSYGDIASQVRYVGCHLLEFFGSRSYNCRIQQPTLGFPATLSATLSDGERDGVHSFVKWTGVVPGVELSGIGGIPPYTFSLLANDNFGIDADGKNFRITAAFASETVVSVVWVLEDSNPETPAVSGTVRVEISVPLTLSAALSDGAKDGAYSFVNLMGVLSTVELSGVGGIPPYTFTLLANDNFGIDEDGKNFRITAAFASATVASVVWVLEDSNPETPAVSGTVQVEIFEAPKAQYTVPSGVQVSVSEGTVTPVSGEAGTFQFDPKTNDGVVLKVTGGDLAVTFMDWKLVIGEGNVMEFINAYAIRPSNLPEFTAGFDNLGSLVSQIQYWPIDSGSEQLKWGSSGLNLIGATTGDTNEEREAGLVGKQAFIGQLPSSFSPAETGLVVVMCGYQSYFGIEDYVCGAYQNGITSVPALKPPSAENELGYVVVNDPYSETINIPVVGGVPGATGYTFALSPASGYSIGSTSGNTIVLNVTDVAYFDAGVYYVTVSIHDSQTPPQSGTFVLEVRVVPKLTFSDTTLTISQTESASLLSLVNGGNTMYAEDNERTFVVISDNNAHFMAGNDGVLTVGGVAELVGINTVTVQVMDTVPSQAATATLVIDVMERGVKFDRENSNLPASIDPGVDVPLSITLQATGGSQSPSYTFSITEGGTNWLSIVSPNILVVGAGAPASGDHTFKIKVVDGNSTKTDGRHEDEAEITFAFKFHAKVIIGAGGKVEVDGTEYATEGQEIEFDSTSSEMVVVKVLEGAAYITYPHSDPDRVWGISLSSDSFSPANIAFIDAYYLGPTEQGVTAFLDVSYSIDLSGSSAPLLWAQSFADEDVLRGQQAFIYVGVSLSNQWGPQPKGTYYICPYISFFTNYQCGQETNSGSLYQGAQRVISSRSPAASDNPLYIPPPVEDY